MKLNPVFGSVRCGRVTRLLLLIETPFLFAAIASEDMNVWITFGAMILAFAFFFPLTVRMGRSFGRMFSLSTKGFPLKNSISSNR